MSAELTWAGLAFLIKVVTMTAHAYCERHFARWLPWWRRYLTCLVWVMHWMLWLAGRDATAGLFQLVAVLVFHWNVRTATRNRNGGDDQRKREANAAETRLTEIQAGAFRRETMEAR